MRYYERMPKRKENTKQFRPRLEDFEPAHAYVSELLNREEISGQVANETMLVFEALFQKLIDSEFGEDTVLDISCTKNLGGFNVKVGFEGRPFDLYGDGEESIEEKILRGCDDKLGCSYRSGYNVISIAVSRSFRRRLFACAIASLVAIVAYIPIHFLLDPMAQYDLLENYVYPIETMYANAALMVGAPMVFFSLMKNFTDTYVVSQRSSRVRKLQAKTIVTSIVAILLAVVAGFLFSIPFGVLAGSESEFMSSGFDRTFADVVTSSVPPSIFEPFETISPIPLMLVALLVTYALCSAGKYFDPLRMAMEACYTLFSRMLYVVMALLPVFCFFAFMDVLLTDQDFGSLVFIVGYVVVVYVSLILLIASYAIRLRAHGIKVIPFARKLIPLVRENLKIGSSIDAVPYNIRYCTRSYKMDHNRLEQSLPTLAQINLDGNCFIVMLIALIFLFLTGTSFDWLNLVSMGALVLFLSFGAPNQPGSILIGTLIVTMYLHSYDAICAAIYLEAFLATAQNLINVIGDIVIAAIEERIIVDREVSLSSSKLE